MTNPTIELDITPVSNTIEIDFNVTKTVYDSIEVRDESGNIIIPDVTRIIFDDGSVTNLTGGDVRIDLGREDLYTHIEDETIHFTQSEISITESQISDFKNYLDKDVDTTDNLTEGTTNLYDKTVSLTAGDNVIITGTYPNFNIEVDTDIIPDHNDLEGLNEGDYQHLTEEQLTVVENTSGVNTGDVTVTDSDEIDFTLTNQDLTATIKAGSIDVLKLDSGVQTSLGKADSALQSFTETDPVFTAWDKSTGISITESQISDFKSYQQTSEKNQNNGYCGLDSGGKVPITNLPTTLLKYQGVWNASTNTPTLVSPDLTKIGNVYNVSTAGTQFGISFSLGDWLIYNADGIPEKSDNSDDVVSVNGQTGVVSLDADDINDNDTTNKFVTATQKSNWDTAYGWGDHAGLYDTTGTASGLIGTHESTFDHSLIATALQSESDPVFTASQASNITETDITNLSNLSGINTGDQDLSGYITYTGATNDVDLGSNNLTANGLISENDVKAERFLVVSDYWDNKKLRIGALSGGGANPLTGYVFDVDYPKEGGYRAFTATDGFGYGAAFQIFGDSAYNYKGSMFFDYGSYYTNLNNTEYAVWRHLTTGPTVNNVLKLNADNNVEVFNDLIVGDDIFIKDNNKVIFGDGSDSSIYYTGTNMIINPKELGSGYLSVLGDIEADNLSGTNTGDNANLIETLTAGESVVAGDICYLKSDGKYWKAKGNAEATTAGLIRMALASISANATGSFLKRGTWTTSGLTTGATYFLSTSTAGAKTTTTPTTGNFIRVVGVAQSSTVFEFDPSKDYGEVA